MRSIYTFSILLLVAATAKAKPVDTIQVKRGDLDVKALQMGSYSYIIYTKKTIESPAQRLTLVKINVVEQPYHGKPAFVVTQQWDRDTIVHAAYSVFDATDFSTIVHDTWWKSLGYQIKFDFEAKTVGFTEKGISGGIPDSIRATDIKDFNASFDSYNLNWHADLLIYQMLPYKENRTFVINYYDPGFGAAEKVMYTVTGSDFLINSRGEKVDCWVLSHTDTHGSERFWITKKGREVLKEEDHGPGIYRYKIKFDISGDK